MTYHYVIDLMAINCASVRRVRCHYCELGGPKALRPLLSTVQVLDVTLHLGANRMEALRTRNDNLQWEVNRLGAENQKLRSENPDLSARVDLETSSERRRDTYPSSSDAELRASTEDDERAVELDEFERTRNDLQAAELRETNAGLVAELEERRAREVRLREVTEREREADLLELQERASRERESALRDAELERCRAERNRGDCALWSS